MGVEVDALGSFMLGLFLLVSDRDGYEQERPQRWQPWWESPPKAPIDCVEAGRLL
jgi:hypothetical protein